MLGLAEQDNGRIQQLSLVDQPQSQQQLPNVARSGIVHALPANGLVDGAPNLRRVQVGYPYPLGRWFSQRWVACIRSISSRS